MLDRAGNFVLPRADVMKLRDRLRNEELVAGSFFSRLRYGRTFRHDPTSDVDHRRVMCAHARILALEEAPILSGCTCGTSLVVTCFCCLV